MLKAPNWRGLEINFAANEANLHPPVVDDFSPNRPPRLYVIISHVVIISPARLLRLKDALFRQRLPPLEEAHPAPLNTGAIACARVDQSATLAG